MGTKSNISFITIILCSFLFCFASCKKAIINQEEIKLQHKAISNVLYEQQKQWNDGNLEKFMLGYWNSEDLSFTGKSGITKGWQQTLENYKKGYPDKEAMGILNFEIIEIRSLSIDKAYMLGKYELTRKADKPSGYFSLLWEKIEEKWVITADHTSG